MRSMGYQRVMKHIITLVFVSLATAVFADSPKVEGVVATRSGDAWRFDVTVSHADTGWEDYADGWRVLGLDGAELGVRVLTHPHVNEQPFTRSLTGVHISKTANQVKIEARDSVGGWSSTFYVVDLK